ncbi:MAG: N-acyl homoserine lactonase family protein [Chloroflexi bacterium]|nr:N-acyl homoserine lactonase family protein [Chloroflexota bacterium]
MTSDPATVTSSSSTHWRITALDTGTSHLDQSMLTYTVGVGTVVRIPRVIWVLQGPTTVVVDTSVPMRRRPSEFIGEEFSRSRAQEPANALRDAGIDPRDVEHVVLTHLHWDHAGNCDLFPEARVVVQREELRYAIDPGRFFRKSFLSPRSGWGTPPWMLPNIDTVDGLTELAPGLRLVPTPGHTPGSQALVADTEHGSFCIAGDAISLYANIEQDIPPGFHVDVDDAVDSMDRLRGLADHFLPSHDYEVLSSGLITPIGASHAARPRYVPPPIERWDPEPDEPAGGAPR